MARFVSAALGGWSARKSMRPVFRAIKAMTNNATMVVMTPSRNERIEETSERFGRATEGTIGMLLYVGQPIVFFQNFLEPVVRQGGDGVAVESGHGFGGDQGVYHGFFRRLDGGFEEGVHLGVG